MCGICGYSWEDPELVSKMADRLLHRGPDDRGQVVGGGASLGHTRLSIIDLSANGRQPLANEDGSVQAVINGEIYNQLDLRRDLEAKGHVFSSRSDSETVVHAYEEWGPDCCQRLSGMFCFALHDRRRRRLLLARDRLGIKPLYYHHDGRRLVFANEIKALLAWPGLERRVDLPSLYHYLGYEFVPAPGTLFAGVRKLRQGHYAVFEQESGDFSEERYWDLSFEQRFSRPEEAVEELRAMMRESVRRRLMSDVPLGVFLSGGLDSTSVVALMRQLGVDPLRTYSIAYPDPTFSELPYANQMAAHYQTEQRVLMIEDLKIEDLEAAVYHLDEPMTDLSAIPLMLICRKAKQTSTVVLSGEGGDEIFCGYDRFLASKAAAMLRPLGPLLRWAHALSRLLPDRPQKKGAVNVMKRFLDGAVLPAAGGHLRWQYFLANGMAQALFNEQAAADLSFEPFAPLQAVLAQCNSPERLDQEVYSDLKLTMADSVLMKVDKMSMSTALEVRVPFLDHELVELTASLPGWFKLKGFTTKYILRQAIRGLVPDEVVFRGKQGYSLPVKNLLRGQLRPLMEELLRTSPLVKDYLRPSAVNTLMDEHLSGRQNHNHVLWALMNAALWHRRFLEN